jgi:hypothetical protein
MKAYIVNGRQDVIMRAALKGNLEFARHAVGEILAQEGESNLLSVGTHIEEFIVSETRFGAGSDVANGVETSFARGHARIGKTMHQVGHIGKRNEVVLQILAGGQMAAAAGEFVGNGGEGLHLECCDHSGGKLGAYHLDAGLALAVDAMAQAETAEFVFGYSSTEIFVRALAETLDF